MNWFIICRLCNTPSCDYPWKDGLCYICRTIRYITIGESPYQQIIDRKERKINDNSRCIYSDDSE